MKSINNVPGYKINEYLLVLNPHEELRNKIMNIKQHFAETYKAEAAVYLKPHLMLANFVQYQMMEERLLNRLKIIAMGYHPIKIELKDYNRFPAHSIYINVTSKLPIQNLVKQVRSEAQQLMHLNKETKAHFMLEPNVIIARKLQPWQFEKGWLEYSHKQFTGRFIADGMLLLKRSVGQMKYEILKRFEFENLPVTTMQGALAFPPSPKGEYFG